MSIQRTTVHRVAELARLELSDDELDQLTADIGEVLDYVAKLESIEFGEIEPTSHPLELDARMRPDEAQPSATNEQALANAPADAQQMFLVPRIISE
ncbi:MAG: Asp-tRNA(Asn)/Glu-tRNA(Gln) amidotransferase subunit GatC [Candidatus Alcyoniella australis]|nr:Asp-tRNA(Asn)/Glu-tRNA(Gln) amidotransferase subunit GatC [Candidatus Alcyoniella australis]